MTISSLLCLFIGNHLTAQKNYEYPCFDVNSGETVYPKSMGDHTTLLKLLRFGDDLVCEVELVNNSPNHWMVPQISARTCDIQFSLVGRDRKPLKATVHAKSGPVVNYAKYSQTTVVHLARGSRLKGAFMFRRFFEDNVAVDGKARALIELDYPLEPDNQFHFASKSTWVKLPFASSKGRKGKL